MTDLANVIKTFSVACNVSDKEPRILFNSFISLQINAANWEEVYETAMKKEGGKDISSFKYDAKNGAIEKYTRVERSHKFPAKVWVDLFEGATIDTSSKSFKKEAAGFIGFCQKVCDPISSDFREDQRLMLYFLMNTKQKNMRELIQDEKLNLGLKKKELARLFSKMNDFELKEDNKNSLAKEIGMIISSMEISDTIHRIKRSAHLPRTQSFKPKNRRFTEKQSTPNIAIVRGSDPEGWSPEKMIDVTQNPIASQFRKSTNLSYAPAKKLSAQIFITSLSSETPQIHPSKMPLANSSLDRASERFELGRQSIIDTNSDIANWKNLIQVVGYNESKKLATSPELTGFYKSIFDAIPKREKKDISSKTLVQRFILAHMPNWKDHWSSNWSLNPKLERSVSNYLSENPTPTKAFIETLVESFK